jgi:TPR repeat protein
MRREDAIDMELSSGLGAFVAKEFARAMQLLSPLADAGHPEARFRVAIMYQNGLGVLANAEAALVLMRGAAVDGHGLAQHLLGVMHLNGEGTIRDPSKAALWFEKASAQGLDGATMALAQLYRTGDGVPLDGARADALEKQLGLHCDGGPG